MAKANFHASRHAQLHHLCCVIQSNMFTIIILLASLYFHFSRSLSTKKIVYIATVPSFPLVSYPDVLITMDATPCHLAFYFLYSCLHLPFWKMWSGCLYNVYTAFQKLQAVRLILHLLFLFNLVRLFIYIWIIVLLHLWTMD